MHKTSPTSGLFTFLSLTACLIYEYVMLENKFWGDFENQNQTNRAIKLQLAILLKYLEWGIIQKLYSAVFWALKDFIVNHVFILK